MKLTWRAWLLVLLVALAASANTLRNGFVYDDVPIVVEDPRLHEGPGALLLQPYWPPSFGDEQLYRPVTSVTLSLDWRAVGGRPLLYHAENLALHLGVVALVLCLSAMILPPAGAIVAGLWFAVQPVHAEAVANVVGRAELLAALFYLLVVLAYLKAGDAGRPRGRRVALWCAVFFGALLAYGSKEHALTLPAGLLLVDAAAARGAGERLRDRLARSWPAWALSVAAGVLFLLVRYQATGTGLGHGQIAAGLEGDNPVQRFVAMLPAYATWARLYLLPIRLQADYSPDALHPTLSLTALHLAGLAALAGALAAAWWARRRAPAITLGIAWLVVTASVSANIVVPTGVLVAERTLYLPSAGVALALAGAWLLLPRGRWLWPLTALAIALLGARTVERDTLWRSNGGFFARLATDAPDSYRSRWMRGAWEFRQGHFAAGERLYREAIAIYPGDPQLVAELGMWYIDARLWAPADQYLTAAIRMDSTRVAATVKAIIARTEAGRNDDAVALARASLARWPSRQDVLLAALRAEQVAGHADEAEAISKRLLVVSAPSWQVFQLAGDASARANHCDRARQLVGRAAALAPRHEAAPRRLLAMIGTGQECASRIR